MWSHSRTCVPKRFISLVHPCLIYLFKIYLASSTYHELRFLRRGVWAWEPFWCSVLFYLALQHKTCLHVDACVYLLKFRWEFVSTSAARGFPLSGRSWKERGKNSRRWFVSISVEETTPAHFPQAMVVCRAVSHSKKPVATVKSKLMDTYYLVTATEMANLPGLLQGGLGIPGGRDQLSSSFSSPYALVRRWHIKPG